MRVYGDDYKEVLSVGAGDICVVVGFKETKTGDTLFMDGESQCMTLAGISIPEPVFFCSIEAESRSHNKDLENALHILQLEDPSLIVTHDPESDQIILKGLSYIWLWLLLWF